MELNQLTFHEQPELRQPDLVIAFAGWSDAAQAATGTVAYLVRRLDAKRFAEIKAEEFYDFSSLRPMVTVDRGLITSLKMPQSSFFCWQNQTSNHDLVLLHGIEPQLHWQRFVDLILDLADRLKVHRIYALGGLYDRTPHTREPRISGLVNEPSLMDVLEKNNIEPIVYQGPSSLHALLMTESVQRKTEVISLWGHCPFYVRAESNPMVCLALLSKLTQLLDIEIDVEELKKSGEYLQQMLSRLLAENHELRQYVKKLEEQYDLQGTAPAELLEDANRIVKEVEDFLRSERHKPETS
ncbi:MAG: PAC2 family protein [Dehalococcoidia bacterium]|nr:PAC2 family protein [Dehalococcoidia bacterium]